MKCQRGLVYICFSWNVWLLITQVQTPGGGLGCGLFLRRPALKPLMVMNYFLQLRCTGFKHCDMYIEPGCPPNFTCGHRGPGATSRAVPSTIDPTRLPPIPQMWSRRFRGRGGVRLPPKPKVVGATNSCLIPQDWASSERSLNLTIASPWVSILPRHQVPRHPQPHPLAAKLFTTRWPRRHPSLYLHLPSCFCSALGLLPDRRG